MHASLRKLLAMMLVLSLAVFLAAGCGDDDDDDAGSDDDTAQEESDDSMDDESMEGDDEMMEEPAGNILEVATAAGNFTTLATAVTEAGLVETLSGEGPFTVFAPSDDAFADPAIAEAAAALIPADTPEKQQQLAGILTYHVVEGAVYAEDLSDGMTVDTVNGAQLTVNIAEDGTVTLTGGDGTSAMVVTPDVEATNGVIHVIDAVLLPPAA